MMELRLMTEPELARWYAGELSEAFPPNERKPLDEILALRAQGRYEIQGLFDEGAMLGYATFWMEPKDTAYILLDYLGVTAARRNGGLGGEILRRVVAAYSGRSRVLTEAEQPVPGGEEEENAIRRRRIAFYERSGFAPLYDMATCGMRFLALIGGEAPQDLAPVMAAHRAVYGPARTDVKIPLGPGEVPEQPHWMKG